MLLISQPCVQQRRNGIDSLSDLLVQYTKEFLVGERLRNMMMKNGEI